MNLNKLERLNTLLTQLQHETEDEKSKNFDKEGARVIGRAKDYSRILICKAQGVI